MKIEEIREYKNMLHSSHAMWSQVTANESMLMMDTIEKLLLEFESLSQTNIVSKIGNKYKVISKTSGHGFKIGEIVTCTHYDGDENTQHFINDEGDEWCLDNNEIEEYKQPDSGWIKIKDEKPKLDTEVIASDGEYVFNVRYESNQYSKNKLPRFTYRGRVNFPWYITHWMPLPNTPKEK